MKYYNYPMKVHLCSLFWQSSISNCVMLTQSMALTITLLFLVVVSMTSKKTLQCLLLILMLIGVMGVVESISIGYFDKSMKAGSHCWLLSKKLSRFTTFTTLVDCCDCCMVFVHLEHSHHLIVLPWTYIVVLQILDCHVHKHLALVHYNLSPFSL